MGITAAGNNWDSALAFVYIRTFYLFSICILSGIIGSLICRRGSITQTNTTVTNDRPLCNCPKLDESCECSESVPLCKGIISALAVLWPAGIVLSDNCQSGFLPDGSISSRVSVKSCDPLFNKSQWESRSSLSPLVSCLRQVSCQFAEQVTALRLFFLFILFLFRNLYLLPWQQANRQGTNCFVAEKMRHSALDQPKAMAPDLHCAVF